MEKLFKYIIDNIDKIIKSLDSIIRFIKKHTKKLNIKCILFIFLSILVLFILLFLKNIIKYFHTDYLVCKNKVNVETIIYNNTHHACSNTSSLLCQMVEYGYIETHLHNGSMNCEVEYLIDSLLKKKYSLRVVGILIHKCPSSPMRQIFNTNTVQDIIHSNNIKNRHILQKKFLKHKIDYRYYNFYKEECENYHNFIQLKKEYHNNIFGKQVNIDNMHLSIGSYYFIYIENRVIVFVEKGGIQFDLQKNISKREMLFHNYSVSQFKKSIYYHFFQKQDIIF